MHFREREGKAFIGFVFRKVLFCIYVLFLVLEKKNYFNIVLTWNFVEVSKASVLYIYIDYGSL